MQFMFYAGVFCLTSATLMLELVQTRLLSVIAWYYLAFFVISIAMFGLSAGAVWVYLRGNRFTEKTLSADLGYFSAAFALATVISLAVQMTMIPIMLRTVTSVVIWAELAVIMAIPFFFSGVAVSLALTRSPYPIGRVYGVDLIGAAVGCLGILLLLNATDGPSAMLWVAATAAVAALFFVRSGVGARWSSPPPGQVILGRPVLLTSILAVLAIANGLTSHGLRPIAVKGKIENPSWDIFFEEWNSFSRVAVFRNNSKRPHMWGPSPKTPFEDWPVDQVRLNIDGAAATTLYRVAGDLSKLGFLKYDITNLAYYLPDRKRAAVIGVGGGRDILSAWTFGLRDVTGVEINPIFIKLLTEELPYANFTKIDRLKGVKLVIDEARSWFARSDQSFDLIQMSLVDTWAATGAGAFTLSENGLYTTQAWRIFLERLTPDGVFTVSRWYNPGDINETGRMVSLAVASLMDLGVTQPSRHIFLASTGRVATLVVSRSSFPQDYVDALESAATRLDFDLRLSPGTEPASEVLRNIASAEDRAALERYTAGLKLDLTPPTDDRPFFFNQLPLYDPVQVYKIAARSLGSGMGGVLKGNLHATATLLVLLLVSLLLVVATIVIPLSSAVRDVGRRLAVGGTAYFFLIGVGFMMIEIGLLQRMSVFLGHPIYSLSVVLFTVILSTGVGSLISDRLPVDRRRVFAVWAVATSGYVLALTAWLPGVLLAFDSESLLVRAALCVAVMTPAGLLLGFGFPTGMRLISAVDRRPTPWFWGINGGAGVLASIIAVATSLALGINVTLWLGASCYLLLVPAASTIGFRPVTR